ncbi:MAG: fold [Mucilaginibacter sp.]|nr:fold [Mucilaginibacter sp.]
MKIKNKLLLGFGMIFIVVLILGMVSLYYIEVISKTSSVTLKNNYATLTFTREMRSVLDEHNLPLTPQAADIFSRSLKKQENNITEYGEKEATAGVRKAFSLLIDPASNLNQQLDAQRRIYFLLNRIDDLNMKAIVHKNDYTHSTMSRATIYLGGIGFITFLIIFVLVVNFPGFILNPLLALTEGLQEITNHNFNKRLDFKTSEEFTQLADAYNTMASEIGKTENAHLTKIILGDLRIKTLIEVMEDKVIGVNEKNEILFMNTAATELIYRGQKNVTGKESPESINLLGKILNYKSPEIPLKLEVNGTVSYFCVQSFEINAPNLKFDSAENLQYAAYPAGMILILRAVPAPGK